MDFCSCGKGYHVHKTVKVQIVRKIDLAAARFTFDAYFFLKRCIVPNI